MWQLLKADLRYNSISFIVAGIIPIIYTIYILIGHPLGYEHSLVSRLLWPSLIGLLSVLLIIQPFAGRIIKNRDNIILPMPIKLNEIILSRILIILIPYLFLLFYLIVVHKLILTEWPGIIQRILFQYGVNALLASSIAFAYEYSLNSLGNDSKANKWLMSITIIIAFLLLNEFLIFRPFENIVPIGGIIFSIEATLIFVLSNLQFKKRVSFQTRWFYVETIKSWVRIQ